MKNNKLKITLLAGCSVDGKITVRKKASSKSFSKLLSKGMSAPVAELRSWADAILVSSGTVLYDNPNLKIETNKNLKRIVIDRNLKLPLSRNIFDGSVPTFVVTNSKNISRISKLKKLGVDCLVISNKNFFTDLKKELFLLGIRKLLIEGGGNLNSILLENKFVDTLCVAYFPFIVGGKSTPSVVDGGGIFSIDKAIQLKLLSSNIIDKNMIFSKYKIIS